MAPRLPRRPRRFEADAAAPCTRRHGRFERRLHRRAVGGVDGCNERRPHAAVDAEAVLGPADRAREHAVGVGHAGAVVAVVVIGGRPGRAVQGGARSVGGEQVRRRHHRVEVVIDRRMLRRHVVVAGRAAPVDVAGLHQIPGRYRPVGDVELHGPAAAAGEVEALVGAGRGRERRLLHVDRGEQQPVDAERPLRRAVDRIEAFHPTPFDVHLRGTADPWLRRSEAPCGLALLRGRGARDDRPCAGGARGRGRSGLRRGRRSRQRR